jgi:hypothetical protein
MEASSASVPKRRSQADKIGKHKYEIALLHRLENRLDRIEKLQRIIVVGLEDYFKFDKPYIYQIATENELDRALLDAVYESGPVGVLTKVLCGRLKAYGLEKHRAVRIIRRINKKVELVLGKPVMEKRGLRWAFTDFGNEIWGKLKDEVEESPVGE